MSRSKNRDTICLEDAQILSQISFPGNQYIIRLEAPDCAKRANPGTFAHLTCDPDVPMRRPLSIMRANANEGWLEFLYKPVGPGLAHLAKRSIGDRVSMLGPIGRGFKPDPQRSTVLAIGGGVGIRTSPSSLESPDARSAAGLAKTGFDGQDPSLIQANIAQVFNL